MLERVVGVLAVLPFVMGAAAVPADEAQVAFSFQDPDITESSGLAVVDGLVVTTNDSGDSGRLFAVDPATGETVGSSDWSDDPTDVEALAPSPTGDVWVGDIGDNGESRDHVEVALVGVRRAGVAVQTQRYRLVYPDGAHDAETLLCDPTTGRLYVATKGVLGGTLYAAPAQLDPDGLNELEPLGDVLPIATDGTFLADGTRLVIRNYAVATVYAFPSLERLDQLQLPEQEQGEGIAVDTDGTLLISSEGQRQDVLRVPLPEPAPSAEPTPTTESSATESATPTASPSTTTRSREDRELPESTETERSAWPWFLSGLIGVGFITALAFSLRRR